MIPSVLAKQARQGLEDFLRTTFPVTTNFFRDKDGITIIDHLLADENGIFKGPYISVQLPFRRSTSGKEFFPNIPLGYPQYLHQEMAFRRLGGVNPKSTIVATGTGSGKTECFLYPILNYCHEKRSEEGIKAILIYPMNALASDQAGRIAKIIHNNPNLKDRVTAGLYVGGEGRGVMTMGPDHIISNRDTLRLKPPDILLTNYKMLDYLLIRPEDYPLWKLNGPETMRYLTVDELHTFDGAQGTDLACLIRRLKARLNTPGKYLCAVGTSATLGGGESEEKLRKYAESIFGESFEPDSVIGESRITAGEFWGESFIEARAVVSPLKAEELNPEIYETFDDYVRAQHELWFGVPIEKKNFEGGEWRVALGERLKSHPFFRNFITAMREKARSDSELITELEKFTTEFNGADPEYRRNIVNSLLALVSTARLWKQESEEEKAKREAKGKPRPTAPFLHVRVQLWLRELRRMVCKVDRTPAIRFADDLNEEQLQTHTPMVHCRECGALGWAGMKRRTDNHINSDLQNFYVGFFGESPNVIYLFPDEEVEVIPGTRSGIEKKIPVMPPELEKQRIQLLCPACLHLYAADETKGCANCGNTDLVRVFIPDSRRKRKNGRWVSHRNCPFCSAREGLTVIGSRAASLTSVLIGQLYASSFNDDKKLLTFSDSVQDASHRAGFFAARTYRLNLRGAIQQFLLAEGDGKTLAELPAAFSEYWRKQMDEAAYIAAFIAPDMTWLRDYEYLIEHGKLPKGSNLRELVDNRVSWEIAIEYAFRARIGRTLEKTGSSVAHADPEFLNRMLAGLLEKLRNEIGELRELDEETLRRFLLGMIVHLKNLGGVHLPFLDGYIDNFGNAFLLNRVFWMPRFGRTSRAPVFLVNRSGNRFLQIISASDKHQTWHLNWIIRNLFPETILSGDAPERAYKEIIKALSDSGLFFERKTGGNLVWGINSESLRVSRNVIQLKCGHCGHNLSVAESEKAHWSGCRCLRFNCPGTYDVLPPGKDFYGKLYAKGDLQRIYAEEHTGLLDRDVRDKVEKQFKSEAGERKPWYPNLLSCTPTLELGIDIGDLSSLILCSVPPAQANYLQRIGRAGRRDGNALNLTVANARPHDLYFFSEPTEMISGQIETPGVFLNASAVLERQFTAFCFDRWVETGKAALPHKMQQVLGNLEPYNEKKFPYNFLLFIENRQSALFDSFVKMFSLPKPLQPETINNLKSFVEGERNHEGSLRYRIMDGLHGLKKELDSLKGKVQSLNKKVRAMEKDPAKDKNYQDDIANLRREKEALQALIKHINDRDTFNFFTDEGLIPNYAFPQAGVILRSVIYRKKEKIQEGESSYDTWVYEYERSAVNAIAELAPENQFYAGGRKVKVDQIDMNVSEVETWRLCNNCSHTEMVGQHGEKKACPKCGSLMWADEGQKAQMLRMRTVFATSEDRESRIGDDSDDREPTFYNKHLMVDFDQKDCAAAYRIDNDELPFGFEFIRKATFREINFGEKGEAEKNIVVAGAEMPSRGFTVCRHCGKVQNESGEIKHAFTCPSRDKESEKNLTDCLFLYRDFSSEAIRMLLPVTTFSGSDRKLHSFVASLHLGLKQKFGGNIDHLQTTVYEEPVLDSEYRKKYLVLYDTVPGGTGYLKELTSSKEKLMEVFEKALSVLKACSCNQDANKDGCYRCLYAYRSSYNMSETSRNAAVELLSDILRYKENLVKTDSIADIKVNALFDSELEARFIESLQKMRSEETSITIKKELVNGKPGYFLKIGEQAYNIEPQVLFGENNAISVVSKADFVFWPAKKQSKVKPIVVFLDGWEFHKDRIGKDMAQRMAFPQSDAYHVWSLTWRDVDRKFGKASDYYINYIDPAAAPNKQFSKLKQSFKDKVEFLDGIHSNNSFDWFIQFLKNPDENKWSATAFIYALMYLEIPPSKKTNEWADKIRECFTGDIADRCLSLAEPILCGSMDVQGLSEEMPVQIFAGVEQSAVNQCGCTELRIACLLDDSDTHLKKIHAESSWTGFLRMYNLFQFIPCSYFVTHSGMSQHAYDPLKLLEVGKQEKKVDEESAQSEWLEIRDYVAEELHGLIDFLKEKNLPVPDPGYPLTDENGKVIAEAEMGWGKYKVAFLKDEEYQYEPVFERHGWKTYRLSDILADLKTVLKIFESGKE